MLREAQKKRKPHKEAAQWTKWIEFATTSGRLLEDSFATIEATYINESPDQKHRILVLHLIWTQIKDFLLSTPKDVCSVIFHYAFSLLSEDERQRQFTLSSPIPSSLDFSNVKEWFQQRLFINSVPPVDHVYVWLFHWFGFTSENWGSRERNLMVVHSLLFIRKLIDNKTFFFGFGVKESEAHIRAKDPGTFMLRLSSSQVSAVTVTYVAEKKQVYHVRLSLLAGFLLYLDGWAFCPIRGTSGLIRDARHKGRVNKGISKYPLKCPLMTNSDRPQYCPHYCNTNNPYNLL